MKNKLQELCDNMTPIWSETEKCFLIIEEIHEHNCWIAIGNKREFLSIIDLFHKYEIEI